MCGFGGGGGLCCLPKPPAESSHKGHLFCSRRMLPARTARFARLRPGFGELLRYDLPPPPTFRCVLPARTTSHLPPSSAWTTWSLAHCWTGADGGGAEDVMGHVVMTERHRCQPTSGGDATLEAIAVTQGSADAVNVGRIPALAAPTYRRRRRLQRCFRRPPRPLLVARTSFSTTFED